MKKSALWAAFAVTIGLSMSACSSDKEAKSESGEVMAVDRVEAAADLARKNGPKAEDMVFEETAPVATAEADMTAAVDAPDSAEAASTETAAAAPEVVASNVGEQLYNKQCMACHATGLLNAPKYGDAAAWAPRIAKGKETLYTHAANGFNQMNAQVNAEVSEDQVHAAVDYMVAAAS
ncbi:cytochrome c5 family protein [Psychrobacter frigidicola]|uniref:Cytochrome c5 family protein n=1 Tax=Psychrobacter frigidicola TaxID=45611 RepID=A0A5C7A5A4_9GAMM|nr:c-type cytochrome [Psychrobacter frigidicola]TXD96983.1 cytochrome c5 family protein [Psychrobacter frigidicola]